MRAISEELLIEVFAEVAHDVWIDWAKSLIQAQQVSKEKMEGWKQFFVPYIELSEPAKELDRAVARKYVAALKKLGVL